jgi:hypothetical protein
MKLFIEDTGRNGETEIAVVLPNDEIKIHAYTHRDLVAPNRDRLSAAWWKAQGYRGRLEITDSDLGSSYVVNVK